MPKSTTSRQPRSFAVGTLPSREDILAAMAENPGLDGKRDLAKRFGIKGDMRTPFKVLLKEMEADGILTRTRKQIRRTGEGGDGLALAGIIIGGIVTGIWVLLIVVLIISWVALVNTGFGP